MTAAVQTNLQNPQWNLESSLETAQDSDGAALNESDMQSRDEQQPVNWSQQ